MKPDRIATWSCGKAGPEMFTLKALNPSVIAPGGAAPTTLRTAFVPLQIPFSVKVSAPFSRIPQAVVVCVAVAVALAVTEGEAVGVAVMEEEGEMVSEGEAVKEPVAVIELVDEADSVGLDVAVAVKESVVDRVAVAVTVGVGDGQACSSLIPSR